MRKGQSIFPAGSAKMRKGRLVFPAGSAKWREGRLVFPAGSAKLRKGKSKCSEHQATRGGCQIELIRGEEYMFCG
jgi:hypothetical protein